MIQVKGTNSSERRDGTLTIRLKISHLSRWVNQLDPVLVCVFHAPKRRVYAFCKNERFSIWELATKKNETLNVTLSRSDIFSLKSARRFLWKSRFEQWSRMLSWYESHSYYSELMGGRVSDRGKLRREGNVIVLTFLKSLGIVGDDKISQKFRCQIRNGANNFTRMNASSSQDKLRLFDVFTLALMNQVYDVCGIGLPANLMLRGAELCDSLVRAWHRHEYAEARDQFERN